MTKAQITVDQLYMKRFESSKSEQDLKRVELQVVQGDYENVFTGGTVKATLDNLRIATRFSSPYNHAQNGRIENAWYHLLVMTHGIMEYAGFSPTSRFWIHAFKHVVNVWNNIVHNKSKNLAKSPYEQVTLQKPDLSLIRIWGCPAYFLDPQENKLMPRGRLGINLGRDPSTKDAYFIYDAKRNRIYTRRDVTFDESWKERENALKLKIKYPTSIENCTKEDPIETETKIESSKINENDILAESDEEARSEQSDFDASEHYEITEESDRYGYTKIIRQVSDDAFEVKWPVTTNITQDAINARINATPVPFIIKAKEERSDGNFNVAWENSIENREDLDEKATRDFEQNNNTPTEENNSAQIVTFEQANVSIIDSKQHHCYATIIDTEHIEPTTFKQACEGPDRVQWFQAMDAEIDSLIGANTWTLVDAKEAKNVITGKWVYKLKYRNGKLEKYKARYCARGFTQKYGIDYEEVFSPVARSHNFRLLSCTACQRNDFIYTLDIKNAFVHAKVPDEMNLYVSQPKGYEETGPNGKVLVCRLNKFLYGLLQSSREFNNQLDILLKNLNFKVSESDPCVYYENVPENPITLLIYVDDFLVTCHKKERIYEFATKVDPTFPIKVMELDQLIGVEIFYDKESGILEYSQRHHIENMLKQYGYESSDLKTSPTPMEHGWSPSQNPEEVNPEEVMGKLGSLNYLVMNARPDIAYAVGRLQREMQHPTQAVLDAIDRIFRYLKGTLDLKIIYKRMDTESNFIEDFLIGYKDASWGVFDENIDNTYKSTNGYVHRMGNTPISWSSKLQKGKPAQSSAEAEYRAAYHAIIDILSIKETALDIGWQTNKQPLILYTDSEACMNMSKNPVNYKTNKNIALKYHWVRHTVKEKEVSLHKIHTTKQLADMFTKVLITHKQFKELRDNLLE
jgi:ribonuclease HI